MSTRMRMQTIAMLAVGGLIGYAIASRQPELSSKSAAAETNQAPAAAKAPAVSEAASSVCLTEPRAKTELLAMAADNEGDVRVAQAPRRTASGKRPNIVMLMTDDTGWGDFGCYGGGQNLGHPTPNIDQVAKEGAVFTSWYGQASCTAGRASFMTGRYPIRSALSVVVAPGDANGLTKSTPTIAEFFQKNGYTTYFSGKWHLGDQPKFYPIEHGFDEMKEFAAYYPGVYTYDDTSWFAHPWFPKFNPEYWDMYQKIVNLYEWEGIAGKPAIKVARIDYDYLHEFDVRQADSAVEYIKAHAKDDKPFFMDVNFMKMHNPNIPAKAFIGKSHLGNYSDAQMELDYNIGGSWRPSGKWLPTPSSSSPPTMARGRMRGRMPASRRSAAKKVRRSRAVSVCPASCGHLARFRLARVMAK